MIPLSAMQVEILRHGAVGESWGGAWHVNGAPCGQSVAGLIRRGMVTIKQDPPNTFGARTVTTPVGWSELARIEDAEK